MGAKQKHSFKNLKISQNQSLRAKMDNLGVGGMELRGARMGDFGKWNSVQIE